MRAVGRRQRAMTIVTAEKKREIKMKATRHWQRRFHTVRCAADESRVREPGLQRFATRAELGPQGRTARKMMARN